MRPHPLRDHERALAHDLRWHLVHTPVSALMKRAEGVPPDLDVEALTTLVLDRGLDCVPVVDREPLGVVSAADLLRDRHERVDTDADAVTHATAADVMTPLVVTVVETMPIMQAAALLAVEQLFRAPVVSRHGKVVGMLSALDVLRWIAAADGARRPGRA